MFIVLVDDRPLILGGVRIPFEKGLLGHSDADVLTHAVCDALFGAAGMGDIGEHFPDSDPQYKGVDSIFLLKQCLKLVRAEGYEVHNIDTTIIAQEPKLSSYKSIILKNLAGGAGYLNSTASQLKRPRQRDWVLSGSERGIAAMCVRADRLKQIPDKKAMQTSLNPPV